MKKLLVIILCFLAIIPLSSANKNKEVTTEYYDLNCDGVKELTYVSITVKETKKMTKKYYDEYWNRLGIEKWIKGRLIKETFGANDYGYCFECEIDSDCPAGEATCVGRMYYQEPGICANGRCSHGNLMFTNCALSMQYCAAECDGPEDCAIDCDPNSCTCI